MTIQPRYTDVHPVDDAHRCRNYFSELPLSVTPSLSRGSDNRGSSPSAKARGVYFVTDAHLAALGTGSGARWLGFVAEGAVVAVADGYAGGVEEFQ